jgi:hypothetical protein
MHEPVSPAQHDSDVPVAAIGASAGGLEALRSLPADHALPDSFRVEGSRAVLARTPDFLSLAGSITVPPSRRNTAWDDVIRKTRTARADGRR